MRVDVVFALSKIHSIPFSVLRSTDHFSTNHFLALRKLSENSTILPVVKPAWKSCDRDTVISGSTTRQVTHRLDVGHWRIFRQSWWKNVNVRCAHQFLLVQLQVRSTHKIFRSNSEIFWFTFFVNSDNIGQKPTFTFIAFWGPSLFNFDKLTENTLLPWIFEWRTN